MTTEERILLELGEISRKNDALTAENKELREALREADKSLEREGYVSSCPIRFRIKQALKKASK